MYSFDLLAANLELQNLVRAHSALLNKTMTAHHNEKFPFGIMPMLSLGNSRFADVDTYLTNANRLYQFCETTARIDIHLERKCDLFLGKIA